jgi:hypothetical protein
MKKRFFLHFFLSKSLSLCLSVFLFLNYYTRAIAAVSPCAIACAA